MSNKAPTDISLDLVLIAEDEEPIAQALSFLIEDAGYQTLIAFDGKQALEMATRHHPALLITDFMMPHLNGAKLIEQIRVAAERDGYALPRVIIMTAGDKRYIETLQVDAILLKPFDIKAIDALLHQFMRPHSLNA